MHTKHQCIIHKTYLKGRRLYLLPKFYCSIEKGFKYCTCRISGGKKVYLLYLYCLLAKCMTLVLMFVKS